MVGRRDTVEAVDRRRDLLADTRSDQERKLVRQEGAEATEAQEHESRSETASAGDEGRVSRPRGSAVRH